MEFHNNNQVTLLLLYKWNPSWHFKSFTSDLPVYMCSFIILKICLQTISTDARTQASIPISLTFSSFLGSWPFFKWIQRFILYLYSYFETSKLRKIIQTFFLMNSLSSPVNGPFSEHQANQFCFIGYWLANKRFSNNEIIGDSKNGKKKYKRKKVKFSFDFILKNEKKNDLNLINR